MTAQTVIYVIGIVMASEAGKGSKPRPILNQKQFDENFDRIFGNKKQDTDWDESRIDIIGSNGNTGIHYDELKEEK